MNSAVVVWLHLGKHHNHPDEPVSRGGPCLLGAQAKDSKREAFQEHRSVTLDW